MANRNMRLLYYLIIIQPNVIEDYQNVCVQYVQVFHHSFDDRRLLEILLTEHGDVGLHKVEQLGDDRCDAAKVCRARVSFHSASECFFHHIGRISADGFAGIHLGIVGEENDIDTVVPAQFFVIIQITGISGKVLVWSELSWVYVDADNDDPVWTDHPASPPNETEMAVVEITHGRYETNLLSGPAPVQSGSLHRGNGLNRSHVTTLGIRARTFNQEC